MLVEEQQFLAEIMLALQFSDKENYNDRFCFMFPDYDVAKHDSKIKYQIQFVIVPYVNSMLKFLLNYQLHKEFKPDK